MFRGGAGLVELSVVGHLELAEMVTIHFLHDHASTLFSQYFLRVSSMRI